MPSPAEIAAAKAAHVDAATAYRAAAELAGLLHREHLRAAEAYQAAEAERKRLHAIAEAAYARRVALTTAPTPKPQRRAKRRQPRKYDRCPRCGAPHNEPRYWLDAFCDKACHESYLDHRQYISQARRDRARG